MPLKKISEFLAASIWLFSTNQYGVSGKKISVRITTQHGAIPQNATVCQELYKMKFKHTADFWM